jgi:Cys-tRNA(Pro)/Cys-tRNA(Cys) deacylase
MDQYEEKLKSFIKERSMQCEHMVFSQSCHSVEEAARAARADPEDFVKNICMVDSEGRPIIAIVKGEDRASTSRVARVLGLDERPRTATPEEILEKTGYPCGGVPSFGCDAEYLIDPRVMEKQYVWTSGGSEMSLIRISPEDLQKANKGRVVRIRK